jgi:hypothetical protein
MSETSEGTQAKRYRIRAPFIQFRKRNVEGRRFGTHVSPWTVSGGYQGGIIDAETIHPDDLRHLLQATVTPARGGGPMLEEIPAS